MSDFHKQVTTVLSTAVDSSETAKACASESVLSKLRMGRHTIEISAKNATVYIGGSDVTSENGRPVPANTTVTIPVDTLNPKAVYAVGGAYILTEYF